MKTPPPRVRHVADGAILVEYADAADEEANIAAVRLGTALRARRLDGFHDAVPGARTLFCAFDPMALSHEALAREIEASTPDPMDGAPSREHRVPVRYGGPAALDLAELARLSGLSPEEVAARHAAARYRVAFLGFAPGFAYMTGLPRELSAPRRTTPRTRVPAGALAVAGPYSGIYPEDGPGGWNLIGSAAIRLFDPLADPPVALLPGDHVVFEPGAGTQLERAAGIPAVRENESDQGEPVFRVEKPGLWSSVCGPPRFGSGAWGIPPGGAMDGRSLSSGNAVLGNAADAPALEIALAGPVLELLGDALVVLAGAPCEASTGGRAVRRGEPARIRSGERLAVGPVRPGSRAYLCVGGGLRASGTGPLRRLAAGDLVRRASTDPGAPLPPAASLDPWVFPDRAVVRIVLGPQVERFTSQGVRTLLESEYRVSPASDRRGLRLEGPRLEFASGGPEIPPEGTALGAIQVPGDGQPIALGPDRPVTGGYAKVGTVVAADFRLLAQSSPGTVLRFAAVTVEEALLARGRMARP